MFLPGALIALALLLILSYWHLRHWGLAVLAVIAPLTGAVGGTFLMSSFQPFAYLAGFIAASFLASAIAAATAAGRTTFLREAFVTFGFPLLCGFLLMGLSPFTALIGTHVQTLPHVFLAALSVAACFASAIVLLPAGALVLRYGENFVTRANRAREDRARWLASLDAVTQPRWGMSFSGIALIFSVLGYFGLRNSGNFTVGGSPLRLVAEAFLILAIAYLAARNFRRALAVLLALVPVVLVSAWLLAKAGSWPAPTDLLLALGLMAMPVLVMAGRASAFERQGHSPAVATVRALEQNGATILAASLAAGLAVALSYGYADPVEGFGVLLGGIAALVLQPALTTAFYALFPKRVSLDAYRLR